MVRVCAVKLCVLGPDLGRWLLGGFCVVGRSAGWRQREHFRPENLVRVGPCGVAFPADSIGVGPGFATVVAGPPVRGCCLPD
jgi:hypothetical protein